MYVAEHVANDVLPDNVQVPENEPVPLVVKVTVPVGVKYVPGELSVTVIVQLVAVPIAAGDVQKTDVAADRNVTVIVAVASGLAAECPESPP